MHPLLHLYSLRNNRTTLISKQLELIPQFHVLLRLATDGATDTSTGRRFIVRWANELDCFYNIYFFFKVKDFFVCLFLQNLFKFNYRERKHNFNEQSFSSPPLTLLNKSEIVYLCLFLESGRGGQIQFLQSTNRKVILNISIKLKICYLWYVR